MRYLVDANVLREATKHEANKKVTAWLREHERELYVDPVILGEIRFGILLLPRGKRRTNLESWFEQGIQRMRCIPWDASVGLRWGQLLAMLRSRGKSMPIKDSLIAATALTHNLSLVTR